MNHLEAKDGECDKEVYRKEILEMLSEVQDVKFLRQLYTILYVHRRQGN